jgi:hypothetical protein
MAKTIKLEYDPQPKQALLHKCRARQILFGGAVGGGKSHALRWDCIAFCCENPGLQAYIFRRSLPELESNHIQQIKKELPSELGNFSESRKRFEFFNGSYIQFQYLERDSDCDRIQGAEIHFAGIDEAGQMSAYQLGYIKSRLRLGGYEPKQKQYLPRLVMTANPGGISHNFLKALYIDPSPPETYFYDVTMKDPRNKGDKGWMSMYIPSRMEDNKYIDPNYGASLSGLPEELARALREGDWDLIIGSFFGDVFRRDRHVIKPFEIPQQWLRFRSFDWGSSKPFCVGWYAVAQQSEEFPDGALIKYREWYGASGPDRGLKLTAEEVAQGIKSREGYERIDFSVGDPSVWKWESGPSIGERMSKLGVRFRRADNSRVAGWDQIRQRLMGDDNIPMLYFFETCTDLIRTLPILQHDTHRAEDINTKSEDHAADELRYACMSRPYQRPLPEVEEDQWRPPTVAEMMSGLDDARPNRQWRL